MDKLLDWAKRVREIRKEIMEHIGITDIEHTHEHHSASICTSKGLKDCIKEASKQKGVNPYAVCNSQRNKSC